ncbi:MAG: tetratricopeptide repeat protein [Terracidiphilus sp.]
MLVYNEWSGALKRACAVALMLAGCGMWAQAQSGNPFPSSQQKPASGSQSGSSAPAAPPATGAQQDTNPFPTDTTNVPVMPSANSPGTFPSDAGASGAGNIALPSDDADPVRSPDDPGASEGTGQSAGSSDSSSGMDELSDFPPDTGKHRNKNDASQIDEAVPHDGPKKDIDIGDFYLDNRNWKGALSRFESAMVQDPENPEVYWGLAEAQRHMGLYAAAKANYLKVVDYDPDSKHGKDAKKILKQPEIANAPDPEPTAGKPKR